MDIALTHIQNNLESIKRVEKDLEYWSARDLMVILGYNRWQAFGEVVKKAQESCGIGGQDTDVHFLQTSVKSTGRPQEDYFLTRYACYLIAQNGDPRKPQIALAQTYFATQTRKQELLELRDEENKRLEARSELKETEKKITATVFERGIKLPSEFGAFKDKHIKALYGGISTLDLKKKRGIPPSRPLADFDSQIELSAKNFALAMTDHNIKEKGLSGTYQMTEEVVKNSKATRQTLLSRDIKPESLKAKEDLKKIESRRKKELKKLRGEN